MICNSESTDCFELNFGRHFPLKLRQIIQARMKAAMLVQDIVACCTPERLEHCTLLQWLNGPIPTVCQLLEGSVVLPKSKEPQVKPSALATVCLLNCTQKPLPSHLRRQPQSAVRFRANPGPTSQNRPAKNWRWENTVHVLIKLSVSMSLNQYLKLSTREFHASGRFTQKDNCGGTQLGGMWRKWAVN